MKLRVYNETLDPKLWDGEKLKEEIKEKLLQVAEDFYNSTDLKDVEIHNILMLGSSANYNWTPESDIDIHVIIDISEIKINEDYARKFMDGLSFKWNTEHHIQIKGHPVEVYLQDIREPNSSPDLARKGASIYSLYDDKWLLKPNKENITFDSVKIKKKFNQIRKRIENLTEKSDIQDLKILMKRIRNYRDAGLSEKGEFSNENLVFKALRHSGDLTKLKSSINNLYDKKLSLPEDGNIQKDKKTKPLNEVLDKNSNLFLGFVFRENYKVIGISVPYNNYSHDDFIEKLPSDIKKELRDYFYGDSYFHNKRSVYKWRYRRDLNTIYWWESPDDEIKLSVENWITENLNIKNNNLKHILINHSSSDYGDSHNIQKTKPLNETFNKTSNLFLGFLNKENFDVIGYSLTKNDLANHEDFIKNIIPYEWHKKVSRNESGFLNWRYRKDLNTIYWWNSPSEEEKKSVENWIIKYGLSNKNTNFNHNIIHWSGPSYKDSHIIVQEELTNKPFLIIGNVNEDLEVDSMIDFKGDHRIFNHTSLGLYGGIRWRYKSKDNKIYWFYQPSDKQKDVVEDHLLRKYNIRNPQHISDFNSYRTQAHDINESFFKHNSITNLLLDHPIQLIEDPNEKNKYFSDEIKCLDRNVIEVVKSEDNGGFIYFRSYGHNHPITEKQFEVLKNYAKISKCKLLGIKPYLFKSSENPHNDHGILRGPDAQTIHPYFDFKESIIKSKKPFLIVGVIYDDLEVKSKIDYGEKASFGDTLYYKYTHTRCGFYGGISWRYKSKTNTVYWWSCSNHEIPQKEKDSVNEHLLKKYGIENPEHTENSKRYNDEGHYVNEVIDKNSKLFLGFLNTENLKVNGTSSSNSISNHYEFSFQLPNGIEIRSNNGHEGDKFLSWRYRKDLNTIYWWYQPKTEDEKRTVENWIISNGISNKNTAFIHKRMKNWEDAEVAHKMNENVDKNSNLFIGFIDKNLNIIGKSCKKWSEDKESHSKYLHSLPAEWKEKRYDDLINWRYRKDLSTVYWWGHPSNDEEEAMDNWIIGNHLNNENEQINHLNITSGDNYEKAHGELDEIIIDKQKNLFIGFVSDENLNVVGTSFPNGGMDCHKDYLETLPYEWNFKQKKSWRYRKDLNTIYWWGNNPSDDEKEAVESWLVKKNLTSNVKLIKHEIIDVNFGGDDKTFKISHGELDENEEIKAIVKSLFENNFMKI